MCLRFQYVNIVNIAGIVNAVNKINIVRIVSIVYTVNIVIQCHLSEHCHHSEHYHQLLTLSTISDIVNIVSPSAYIMFFYISFAPEPEHCFAVSTLSQANLLLF